MIIQNLSLSWRPVFPSRVGPVKNTGSHLILSILHESWLTMIFASHHWQALSLSPNKCLNMQTAFIIAQEFYKVHTSVSYVCICHKSLHSFIPEVRISWFKIPDSRLQFLLHFSWPSSSLPFTSRYTPFLSVRKGSSLLRENHNT